MGLGRETDLRRVFLVLVLKLVTVLRFLAIAKEGAFTAKVVAPIANAISALLLVSLTSIFASQQAQEQCVMNYLAVCTSKTKLKR
ncbi:MAG: hypothetical protein ACR2OJ_03625 [Hyphomicrobiales bacterium]